MGRSQALVRDSARDFLAPMQVGVACLLGMEAAVHTAAQYRERDIVVWPRGPSMEVLAWSS